MPRPFQRPTDWSASIAASVAHTQMHERSVSRKALD
jgi:hypothetical protein